MVCVYKKMKKFIKKLLFVRVHLTYLDAGKIFLLKLFACLSIHSRDIYTFFICEQSQGKNEIQITRSINALF